MKKFYTKPQVECLVLSIEEGTCVTASMTENPGFTPVPGQWDTPAPTMPFSSKF